MTCIYVFILATYREMWERNAEMQLPSFPAALSTSSLTAQLAMLQHPSCSWLNWVFTNEGSQWDDQAVLQPGWVLAFLEEAKQLNQWKGEECTRFIRQNKTRASLQMERSKNGCFILMILFPQMFKHKVATENTFRWFIRIPTTTESHVSLSEEIRGRDFLLSPSGSPDSLAFSLFLSSLRLLPPVVFRPKTAGSIAMLPVICRPSFKCLMPRWQSRSPAIHPGGPQPPSTGWMPHLSEADYRCTQTLIKSSKRWGNKSPSTAKLR